MKKVFITTCISLVCVTGIAQNKTFKYCSASVAASYTNYQTFSPEASFNMHRIAFQRPLELKVGINHHSFDATFQQVDQLDTKSVGLFTEAIIFPFHNYLFAGIRWDLFTLNWFTDKALEKLDSGLSSSVFSGTNFYGIVGIDIPVFKKVHFRIYGMPGVQQYKVSDGTFSSGNFTGGTIQENHTRFVYQINAGIVFQWSSHSPQGIH